jgi:hypothetical protein
MQARRLSPEDLARLEMETAENPMVVTAIVRLDGHLDRNALLRLVETRLLVHEHMRERITSGRTRVPSWEEQPTDARDHVTSLASPRPLTTDRDLADAVEGVMRRPLDCATWPWHVYLLQEPRGSALVFRVHHALADGVSLLRLLFAFSDEGVRIRMHDAHHPQKHGDIARRSRAAALARLFVRRADAPPTLSGPLSGEKRLAWTAPIDVEAMRTAAHEVEAHINDVFLAVLAGALRELLPGDERSVLHALVPVALEHDDRGLGNHFVSLFVPLPVAVASPVERVQRARAAMAAARSQSGVGLGRALVSGVSLLGLGRAARMGVRALSRKASLVATNLAGPPLPLRIDGHMIEDTMFAAPTPGSIALSANTFSYAGKLRVTIASDAAVLPAPDRFAALVGEQALATIEALLASRRGARRVG